MDTTPRKRSLAKWFLRTYLGRIVIASVIIVIVNVSFVWLFVVLPFQREMQIANEIKALGGDVHWDNAMPRCFPEFLRWRIRLWNRIAVASFDRKQVDDAGLKHLREATKLNELYVDGNSITGTGLENLKAMKDLRVLRLGETQITDAGLEHLKRLTSLFDLDLNRTQITDHGLEHIEKMTSLKGLYLDNTQVTDNGLERLIGLAQLEDLGLLETQVTDSGLEHIKKMTSLKKLHLSHTLTTPQGRAMLHKALPNCEIKSDP